MTTLTQEEWQASCCQGEDAAREALNDLVESVPDTGKLAGQMIYGAALGMVTETARIMRGMVQPTEEGYAKLEHMILACCRGACRGLDYPIDADGNKIEEMQ